MVVVPSGCVVKMLHQTVVMLHWTYPVNDFHISISVCKNSWLLSCFIQCCHFMLVVVLMALDRE